MAWCRSAPRSGCVCFLAPFRLRPPLLSSVLIHCTSHRRVQGTYLGTLEGVNHLDLVGWINTARYKWAEIMGREIKFKPATFYLGIADHLARVVESEGNPDDQVQGGTADVSRAEREEIRRETERAEMADSLMMGEQQVQDGRSHGAGPSRSRNSHLEH